MVLLCALAVALARALALALAQDWIRPFHLCPVALLSWWLSLITMSCCCHQSELTAENPITRMLCVLIFKRKLWFVDPSARQDLGT
jgi:hypothetical protein